MGCTTSKPDAVLGGVLPAERAHQAGKDCVPPQAASQHQPQQVSDAETLHHASPFARQKDAQELLTTHLTGSGARELPKPDDDGDMAACPARDRLTSNLAGQDALAAKNWAHIESVRAAVTLDDGATGMDRVTQGVFDYDLHTLPPAPLAKPFVSSSGWPEKTDCTLSCSDDDDGDINNESEPEFDIVRWKRFYHWNRKKPQALLRFFWKCFDSRQWSLFACSYRGQDALLSSYQGENLIHGLACRLETSLGDSSLGGDLFGVLHALADPGCEVFKVVGVFLVRGGGASPPQELVGHLEPYDWALAKADTQDPLVHTFVSNLLASHSPVHHGPEQQPWAILYSREVL